MGFLATPQPPSQNCRCHSRGAGSNDPIAKLGVCGLGLLALFIGYRWIHPPTTFAADGVDSDWDSVAQLCDKTEPTVVIFTASWCPACQQVEGEVLSRSDVQSELNNHYNGLTVDLTHPTREVAQHARHLGVGSIPTLIRYDVDGHETSRTHSQGTQGMLEWLKADE